jgi:hypothetical protein
MPIEIGNAAVCCWTVGRAIIWQGAQKTGGSDDPQGILVPGHRPAGMLKRLAWVNRGTQPCRILFVLMDSKQP